MTVLAFGGSGLGDKRGYKACGAATFTSDADFDGGYGADGDENEVCSAYIVTSSSFDAGYKDLSVGDSVYMYAEQKKITTEANSSYEILGLTLGGDGAGGRVVVEANTWQLGVRLYKSGSIVGTEWSGYNLDGNHHVIELRQTWDDGSDPDKWTLELRVDGVSKVTRQFTSVGHSATWRVKGCDSGILYKSAKDGTSTWRTGNMVINDSTGTVATSWPEDEGADGPHIAWGYPNENIGTPDPPGAPSGQRRVRGLVVG